MKRTEYRGYIIDTDDLGRPYIYNTASPYSEESDHVLVNARTIKEAKAIVDTEIERVEMERQHAAELEAEGLAILAERQHQKEG